MIRQMQWLLPSALIAVASSGCSNLPAAETPSAGKPAAARVCSAEVYRQFDFWLGEWDVVQPDAVEAPRARNRITSILRGCALHEDYHSASGFSGESISWYEADWGQWRQTWADSNGLLLQLAGGPDAQGRMVMYGSERQTPEGRVTDRITWAPLDGGRVRQTWDISTDGGKRWRQIFSGEYRPAAPPTPQQTQSKRAGWR